MVSNMGQLAPQHGVRVWEIPTNIKIKEMKDRHTYVNFMNILKIKINQSHWNIFINMSWHIHIFWIFIRNYKNIWHVGTHHYIIIVSNMHGRSHDRTWRHRLSCFIHVFDTWTLHIGIWGHVLFPKCQHGSTAGPTPFKDSS